MFVERWKNRSDKKPCEFRTFESDISKLRPNPARRGKASFEESVVAKRPEERFYSNPTSDVLNGNHPIVSTGYSRITPDSGGFDGNSQKETSQLSHLDTYGDSNELDRSVPTPELGIINEASDLQEDAADPRDRILFEELVARLKTEEKNKKRKLGLADFKEKLSERFKKSGLMELSFSVLERKVNEILRDPKKRRKISQNPQTEDEQDNIDDAASIFRSEMKEIWRDPDDEDSNKANENAKSSTHPDPNDGMLAVGDPAWSYINEILRDPVLQSCESNDPRFQSAAKAREFGPREKNLSDKSTNSRSEPQHLRASERNLLKNALIEPSSFEAYHFICDETSKEAQDEAEETLAATNLEMKSTVDEKYFSSLDFSELDYLEAFLRTYSIE